jgi:Ca2+-binding RTX toxin-like protein
MTFWSEGLTLTILDGGPGNDKLKPGRGGGFVLGGPGRDVIRAANGKVDQLSCGGGSDKAYVDQKDVDNASYPFTMTDCERIFVR